MILEVLGGYWMVQVTSKDDHPQLTTRGSTLMRYLTFVKGPEIPMEKIPPAMFAVMDKYTAEQEQKGVFLSGGGLAPSAQSFRVAIRGGKLVVTDGPFTESKEVIGGWAFVSHGSHEEALASAKEFMELHIRNWPGWEGTCEVRPVMDFVPQK